ncbi:hypothetical protein ACROYT_G019278 [Oculina patagonica]
MPPQSAASSSFAGVPAMPSFPATTSRGEQVNTSSHAYTVNNFHNCQVTFNVIQGQCTSPKSVNPNAIYDMCHHSMIGKNWMKWPLSLNIKLKWWTPGSSGTLVTHRNIDLGTKYA